MRKEINKLVLVLFLLVAGAVEWKLAYDNFGALDPMPVEEFGFEIFNHLLRDCLLGLIVWTMYFRRKRLPDRLRRYFPVVVIGLLYVGVACFMVYQLSLDKGAQTTLAIIAGINNNILLVLLAAMCYYKWPNALLKGIYFVMYIFTALTLLFDAFYFWQTSMHVESVLFQNLNLYAIKGVLATMSNILLAAIIGGVALILLLFQVPKPSKRKPNFVWSLLCVAMLTIGLNLADKLLLSGGMWCVEEIIGSYITIENEKTRLIYRNMLSVPININFVSKALFDTDKMASAKHVEMRELTDKDKKTLHKLGIEVPKPAVAKIAPQYDRVVLLILESMHRDYINYYNENIPEKATPYMNQLVIRYPHLNKYYSSAVPTTQGLNATFRSHLIMDKDVPGKGTPSLFRVAQAAGYRGIFMNASSQYYANELKEYPDQFGMQEYLAKEQLEKFGYTGASGWGYHNDVMYEHTLRILEENRDKKLLLVTKTLDMHQPYPYTGYRWEEMPEGVRDNPNVTVRGVYWVDKTLEHFFTEAEKRGLMDERTLFLLTSDHNPHSGGEYTKLVEKANDKLSIAPIPLLFISKNLVPLDALRTNEYASQIDLAPTLLYLMGLDIPEKFMGRNLLQPARNPFALGYFGGKAFYWSGTQHFVDQMDNPTPNDDEDALSNYIIHNYGLWHQKE
ncbi:MAG: sulfatase-like hydrolase/transferase [Phascolarctobacterium sp.]|nr:sulfatase-like hydrolase/transferase [Phascolarctobacterium sp.]